MISIMEISNRRIKKFVINSEFDKALKTLFRSEKELRNVLDENGNKTLIELMKAHNELLAFTGLENFKIGFRLGVKMICACLVDENGVFNDITD